MHALNVTTITGQRLIKSLVTINAFGPLTPTVKQELVNQMLSALLLVE